MSTNLSIYVFICSKCMYMWVMFLHLYACRMPKDVPLRKRVVCLSLTETYLNLSHNQLNTEALKVHGFQ